LSLLDGRPARPYVAEKAIELGRSGVSKMSEITGTSRPTIMQEVA